MDPVARELLPGRAFRLRDLVLVMRKLQVLTAGVKVKGLAKVFHGHRRALDVPARPAAAERRGPAGFHILADEFPESEIACVLFFILVGINAFASAGDISRKVY